MGLLVGVDWRMKDILVAQVLGAWRSRIETG
jgi:hypothetical protein